MRFSNLVIFIVVLGVAALIAWKMGYIGKAQDELEDSFGVHFAQGTKLYQEMKYEEAITEFEKAIELEPSHPDVPRALRRIGDSYKDLRQPKKAVETYKRILEEYPDDKKRAELEKAILKVEELGYY